MNTSIQPTDSGHPRRRSLVIRTGACFIAMLCLPTLSRAQATAPETKAIPVVSAVRCLVQGEGTTSAPCSVKSDHDGFKVEVDDDGRITVIFADSTPAPSRAEKSSENRVELGEDFAKLEEAGDLDATEAQQITTELSAFDGAVYHVPDDATLKTALNFPAGSKLSPDDYTELIRVHMQLVLSVSPLTSAYLADLLGLGAVASATEIVQTKQDLMGPSPLTTQKEK